jgi:hypothetical protein
MDVHELAYRESDGIEVALLWRRADDRLTVTVFDWRSDEQFELEAPRDRALDVFYHPFAYLRPAARGQEIYA